MWVLQARIAGGRASQGSAGNGPPEQHGGCRALPRRTAPPICGKAMAQFTLVSCRWSVTLVIKEHHRVINEHHRCDHRGRATSTGPSR